MRQYVSSLVVVVLGIACGGTTDTGDEGGAGSASGGTGTAGSHQGGSAAAGAAGKTSAGSNSGGSSAGSVGTAGAGGAVIGHAGTSSGGISSGGISTGGISTGGTGGTGTVNPKCPAHAPMGACSADDANVSCQYEPGTGCLCYPSAPGTYTPCQKVDPSCVYVAPTAAPAPAPPPSGTGGVTAKIALPPHEVCSCVAQTWNCTYGI
jgi:hypothetical protein